MRRPLAMFLAIGAALLLSGSSTIAAGWTQPAKVWDGNYSQPSMVADAHGYLHLAVRGDTGIWYLTNKSGHWTRTRLTTDIVDRTENPPLVVSGYQPQIAFDPWDGSLTVVYLRGDNTCCPSSRRDLRYVTNRSGAWSAPRSIPATHNSDLRDPSIVVRHGVIAVATTEGLMDSSTVEYVTNASGHWTSTVIGPERVAGPYDPSLALDSHGRPVIAYVTDNVHGPSTVRVATGATKTGAFTSTVVATMNEVGDPSLALATDNAPRVAWAAPDGVRYAYRNASGWHATKVMNATWFAELQLDRQGRPHVLGSNDGALWYAHKTSDGWHAVLVDTRAGMNTIALAIGPGGRVNAVYGCQQARTFTVWYTHST
jgi:hypothetical protein